MVNKKCLKVGFDLDGVLLYNPVRIIRPIISLLKKKHIVHRKQLQFYVPKTSLEKFMWYLFHKSSIFPAGGIDKLKPMVDKKKMEAYIITARFDHLKADFQLWQKKINARQIFRDCLMNKNNEQPHIFKERMIKNLKLDIFIEDNWDIVNYLNSHQKQAKIYWIYNIFDSKINYPYKYPSLSKAIDALPMKK